MDDQDAEGYMDTEKLKARLTERFGPGDYKVRYDEKTKITTWKVPKNKKLSKEMPDSIVNSTIKASDNSVVLQGIEKGTWEEVRSIMSFSSTSISEKLRLLSSQQCFVEAPDNIPVKVVTVSATSKSEDLYNDCKAEVIDVVNESDVTRLSGTRNNFTQEDYVSRLICLTQNHSFRPLNVTECMLDTIMYEHEVGHGFLDIVSSFYQKIVRVEEGLAMPFQMYESSTHIEYMYLVRYAEESQKIRHQADPWSIRQSALYHQIRLADQRSTFILISPFQDMIAENSLVQWLCRPSTDTEVRQQAHLANEIVLTSYIDGFRPYMTFYEDKISELWRRMLALGLEEKGSITAQDLAHLKLYETKLLPVCSSLKAVTQILTGLEKARNRQAALCGSPEPEAERDSAYFVFNYTNKASSYQNNLEMLLQRCGSASQLLEGILSFHRQTIAQGQSEDVLKLTKSTVDDSATVRVISAITLVFLSFTAVAAVIAMPLFYLDENSHTLSVSPSIWIYVAVCVPLTLLTILYWRWKLKRKQQEGRQAAEVVEEV